MGPEDSTVGRLADSKCRSKRYEPLLYREEEY